MAVRKTLIDVIDRGLNPGEAHTKLDKKGRLIDARAEVSAPVIAKPEVTKEILTVVSKPETTILNEVDGKTETTENKGSEAEPTVEPKTEVKSVVATTKKQDKSPKPA
jgi:hypothetical protein